MSFNIKKIVDDLGAIKAQISDLVKRESELKRKLIAEGMGSYDGDLFHASVATSVRNVLDMDAVRAKLSPQFIAAHTEQVESVAVRVTARIIEKAA